MATFSISDAAFTGFRIIRQKPKAFGVWLLLQVVLSLISLLVMSSALAPGLAQIQANSGAHGDPQQVMAAFMHMAPVYALLLLWSFFFYPVTYAAMNRAVLEPSNDAFAYLRLGADELRQFGLMLLYGVIMVGIYIASIVLAMIVGMVGVFAAGGFGTHGSAAGAGAAGALTGLLVVVVVFGALAFFGVKLSLASPLTFATRKIDLFGSWTLTRGRFWPIFGTLLVVMCVSLALYLLIAIIAVAIGFSTGSAFGVLGGMFKPDYSPASLLSPGRIVFQLVIAALGTVFIPLWITPPAAIYASLVEGSAASAAGRARLDEVFG